MTDTTPYDDSRLLRRLILLAAVSVVALPITWLGVGLYGLKQTRVVQAELENRGCQVSETFIRKPGDALLAKLLYLLGERAPYPIGTIDSNGSGLTDADLIWLAGLDQLETLNLAGTSVTDAGLDYLRGLPELKSLDLSRTQVTDAGLEHLSGLSKLSALSLKSTHITGAGLESVGKLSNLEQLYLEWTPLDDAGVASLRHLTKLAILDLAGTGVTDAGLEHFAG